MFLPILLLVDRLGAPQALHAMDAYEVGHLSVHFVSFEHLAGKIHIEAVRGALRLCL